MAVKISNIVDIKLERTFNRKVQAAIEKRIKDALRRAEKRALTKAKSIVRKAISQHPVIKGLRGEGTGTRNLKAEFGLTDARSDEAVRQIIKALVEGVKVEVLKRGIRPIAKDFQEKVIITGLSEEELTNRININDEPFTYISVGRNLSQKTEVNTRIRWMETLLTAARTLIEEGPQNPAEYGIKRSGLSNQQKRFSRSGDAIMIHESQKDADIAQGFPYVLPATAIPRGAARNFIDELYRSTKFRSELSNAVRQILLNAIK